VIRIPGKVKIAVARNVGHLLGFGQSYRPERLALGDEPLCLCLVLGRTALRKELGIPYSMLVSSMV
jgi:hypothetical protein